MHADLARRESFWTASQVAILAAGYCTRAYRLKQGDTKVFALFHACQLNTGLTAVWLLHVHSTNSLVPCSSMR